MKQQFMFSFKVLVKTKRFFNCIIFAIIVAFILEFLMFKDAEKLYRIGNPNHSFFFISLDYGIALNLFMMSLPLLSILPYGDTYYRDKEFINQILTRTDKKKYYFVNSVMAFLTGFVFILVLLIFMYYFHYLLLKSSGDNPLYMLTGFSENEKLTIMDFRFLTSTLLDNSALYIAYYSLIISAYAGLLSLTTYSISLFSKNKIITYITPFAITIVSIPVVLLLPSAFSNWLPHIVFSPRPGNISYPALAAIFWIALFLIPSIMLILRKYKKDVLE